jgi:hypothetical protein
VWGQGDVYNTSIAMHHIVLMLMPLDDVVLRKDYKHGCPSQGLLCIGCEAKHVTALHDMAQPGCNARDAEKNTDVNE